MKGHVHLSSASISGMGRWEINKAKENKTTRNRKEKKRKNYRENRKTNNEK